MERGELGGNKQEEPSNIPSIQRGILMDTWEKPCRFINANNDCPVRSDNLFVQTQWTFPVNPTDFSAPGKRKHLNRVKKINFFPSKREWKPSFFLLQERSDFELPAEYEPISTLPLESQFSVALCISPCAKKVFDCPIPQGTSPLPLFLG